MIIPVDALFGQDVASELPGGVDPVVLISHADVIFGVDTTTREEFLVYGREYLRDTANDQASSEASVVRIGIDTETDELHKLVDLVQTIHGYHDYQY